MVEEAEKDALIAELRQLVWDITEMECVQPVDGWDEQTCLSCRFEAGGDCDIWIRREDLMERTSELPF